MNSRLISASHFITSHNITSQRDMDIVREACKMPVTQWQMVKDMKKSTTQTAAADALDKIARIMYHEEERMCGCL